MAMSATTDVTRSTTELIGKAINARVSGLPDDAFTKPILPGSKRAVDQVSLFAPQYFCGPEILWEGIPPPSLSHEGSDYPQ